MPNWSQNQAEEQDFYTELDRRTRPRSYCTCQTLLFGLALILIGGLVGVWWTIKLIRSADLRPIKSVSIEEVRVGVKELKNRLRALLTNQPADAEIKVELTNQELTDLLTEVAVASGSQLKEPIATIEPEGVMVTGLLVKPLKTRLTVLTFPKVVNGQIQFEVKKMTAGRLTIPDPVVGFLVKPIVSLIEESFSRPLDGLAITDALLGRGKMTVVGKGR